MKRARAWPSLHGRGQGSLHVWCGTVAACQAKPGFLRDIADPAACVCSCSVQEVMHEIRKLAPESPETAACIDKSMRIVDGYIKVLGHHLCPV